MKNRALHWLSMVGLLHIALSGEAGSVEIFRIGGPDEPLPDRPGVTLHQLPWRDFEELFGLDEAALAGGIVRPIFLTPEVNIALTSLARGGGPLIQVSNATLVTEGSKPMVDGDFETFYEWVEVSIQESFITQRFIQPHLITLDLGGLFRVNRVRLVTMKDGHYPNKIDIATNAGPLTRGIGHFRSETASIDAASWLKGDLVARLPENVRHIVDVSFPSAPAQSVDLLLHRLVPKAVKVSEIEVYGEGYISRAAYVGPFIELGEPAIWGNLCWRGRQDPQAKVWIQSRAGRDPDPNLYWRYTGRGDEVSRLDEKGQLLDARSYRQLEPGRAAAITYDTENWSFWSSPYDVADSSGTSVLSPAPNSVFQLRVDFLSTVRDGGAVEFIEFEVTRPPLVEEVVGEIFPPEVPLGETVAFTYAIAPTIRAKHSGFDRIEIAAPFGVAGVDTVKIRRVPVAFTVGIERPDSTLFSVHLPRHLQARDSEVLIEVMFRAPVLRYGTAFNGWVRDTGRPLELAQPIKPGNASDEWPSEGPIVRTSLSSRLLGDLQVEPGIITLNGDGVNEGVDFSFDLLQLTDAVPFRLEVFDLSGRLVRGFSQELPQSGHFSFFWDGRDSSGKAVLPGMYVYRLVVEAEQGDEQQSGTIAVVY